MSAKSSKKPKTLSMPRPMAEIQQAYQNLCAQTGQLQYQIAVQTEDLAKLNEQLKLVNREASARQQLDKEALERAKDTETTSQAGA
jgi:hypothetical protein